MTRKTAGTEPDATPIRETPNHAPVRGEGRATPRPIPCCPPAEASTCCAPEAKAACCTATDCGCA